MSSPITSAVTAAAAAGSTTQTTSVPILPPSTIAQPPRTVEHSAQSSFTPVARIGGSIGSSLKAGGGPIQIGGSNLGALKHASSPGTKSFQIIHNYCKFYLISSHPKNFSSSLSASFLPPISSPSSSMAGSNMGGSVRMPELSSSQTTPSASRDAIEPPRTLPTLQPSTPTKVQKKLKLGPPLVPPKVPSKAPTTVPVSVSSSLPPPATVPNQPPTTSFTCPECDKCFSSSWSLTRHRRMHTGNV